ncbi:HAD-IIIA family hydrolase [Ferruginibacter paludis]|uniref:D-glycero-alpha-D-manno-heptose-1,7-bisphosphate 7-phosphatase n=1 Tax=Ferruginibacter paludis TaxID=1310417 RepID=UPI0025B36DE6|nr:HAD-IIIA family hydrolase [Ferruginibacter paludis]MDN3656627.1 HAD-IIIA family hydrolase [Ferruginibacter paludis]
MSPFLIDNSWTLFLDRDGVINHEQVDGYVNTWEDFTFYAGVKEALKIFACHFKYIIVITNQRGVGRGITKPENLQIVHQQMVKEIEAAGGRIDSIYFCIDVNADSINRKPNTGMALQAKRDFTDIDFLKSIMVGNNFSDMEFGRGIGAKTIFLPTTQPEVTGPDKRIDAIYPSLIDFAKSL